MRNGKVLHTAQVERNILYTLQRMKANWVGHILHRNCLLKHIMEGKIERIEVTGKRGRRCKELVDDLEEMRGQCKLIEEALDCILENFVWKRLWICHKTDYRMNK